MHTVSVISPVMQMHYIQVTVQAHIWAAFPLEYICEGGFDRV